MNFPVGTAYTLTSQGSSISTSVGGDDRAILGYVNINIPVTQSFVTIWAGQNSTSGTKIATIDTSTTGTQVGTKEYFVMCHGGIWANLQGGNANVTITVF